MSYSSKGEYSNANTSVNGLTQFYNPNSTFSSYNDSTEAYPDSLSRSMRPSESLDSTEIQNRAIASLITPPHPIQAAYDYSNDKIAATSEIQAYCKIAGPNWTYFVRDLSVVIGRPTESSSSNSNLQQQHQQQKPQVDINLGPSKVVSRKHATIQYDLNNRYWTITVLGRNGLKIDNTIYKQGTIRLTGGNIIEISGIQMMFVLPNNILSNQSYSHQNSIESYNDNSAYRSPTKYQSPSSTTIYNSFPTHIHHNPVYNNLPNTSDIPSYNQNSNNNNAGHGFSNNHAQNNNNHLMNNDQSYNQYNNQQNNKNYQISENNLNTINNNHNIATNHHNIATNNHNLSTNSHNMINNHNIPNNNHNLGNINHHVSNTNHSLINNNNTLYAPPSSDSILHNTPVIPDNNMTFPNPQPPLSYNKLQPQNSHLSFQFPRPTSTFQNNQSQNQQQQYLHNQLSFPPSQKPLNPLDLQSQNTQSHIQQPKINPKPIPNTQPPKDENFSLSYPRGVAIISKSQIRGVNLLSSLDETDLSVDDAKDIKPPYSYATMITQAILSSSEQMLTLQGIYDWISSHYSFYRHSKSGWQNSIRHNLSLSKAFEKIPRRSDEPGKGMKWKVLPEYQEEHIKRLHEGDLTKRRSGIQSTFVNPICVKSYKESKGMFPDGIAPGIRRNSTNSPNSMLQINSNPPNQSNQLNESSIYTQNSQINPKSPVHSPTRTNVAITPKYLPNLQTSVTRSPLDSLTAAAAAAEAASAGERLLIKTPPRSGGNIIPSIPSNMYPSTLGPETNSMNSNMSMPLDLSGGQSIAGNTSNQLRRGSSGYFTSSKLNLQNNNEKKGIFSYGDISLSPIASPSQRYPVAPLEAFTPGRGGSKSNGDWQHNQHNQQQEPLHLSNMTQKNNPSSSFSSFNGKKEDTSRLDLLSRSSENHLFSTNKDRITTVQDNNIMKIESIGNKLLEPNKLEQANKIYNPTSENKNDVVSNTNDTLKKNISDNNDNINNTFDTDKSPGPSSPLDGHNEIRNFIDTPKGHNDRHSVFEELNESYRRKKDELNGNVDDNSNVKTPAAKKRFSLNEPSTNLANSAENNDTTENSTYPNMPVETTTPAPLIKSSFQLAPPSSGQQQQLPSSYLNSSPASLFFRFMPLSTTPARTTGGMGIPGSANGSGLDLGSIGFGQSAASVSENNNSSAIYEYSPCKISSPSILSKLVGGNRGLIGSSTPTNLEKKERKHVSQSSISLGIKRTREEADAEDSYENDTIVDSISSIDKNNIDKSLKDGGNCTADESEKTTILDSNKTDIQAKTGNEEKVLQHVQLEKDKEGENKDNTMEKKDVFLSEKTVKEKKDEKDEKDEDEKKEMKEQDKEDKKEARKENEIQEESVKEKEDKKELVTASPVYKKHKSEHSIVGKSGLDGEIGKTSLNNTTISKDLNIGNKWKGFNFRSNSASSDEIQSNIGSSPIFSARSRDTKIDT